MFLIPHELIDDNPYQRRHDYGDPSELAGRIAAAVSTYPQTRGIMQVPRARVVKNGRAVQLNAPINELLLARLMNDPAVCFQLAYGHRRKRALESLNVTAIFGATSS